jgi:putative phosphoesterase
MLAAVLSDVHGNLPALNAVLSEIDPIHPDLIIVAGDLVGGPNLNETTLRLYQRGARMILGNMDLDLLSFVDGHFSEGKRLSRQWSFMRWNCEQASRETLEILRRLPGQMEIAFPDAPAVLVVHGSPRSPYESIFPDKDPQVLEWAAKNILQQVLICGHIHIPWQKRLHGKLVFNPGAVSSPLNGDIRAHYSLLRYEKEEWIVEHKATPYDTHELRNIYEQSGLLDAGGPLSRAFLFACETGFDIAGPFYEFALSLANRSELKPEEFFPDELWLRAENEFPWESYKHPRSEPE